MGDLLPSESRRRSSALHSSADLRRMCVAILPALRRVLFGFVLLLSVRAARPRARASSVRFCGFPNLSPMFPLCRKRGACLFRINSRSCCAIVANIPNVSVFRSGISTHRNSTPASRNANKKPTFRLRRSNFVQLKTAPAARACASAASNCTRLFFLPLSISTYSAIMQSVQFTNAATVLRCASKPKPDDPCFSWTDAVICYILHFVVRYVLHSLTVR